MHFYNDSSELKTHDFNRGMKRRRINTYNIINVMESVRAYRFRIYPDAKRQREIDEQIELARFLYNKLLDRAKEEYLKGRNLQITKSTFNRFMKEIASENGELNRIYSQALQNVFVRLQRAYQNFFRRVRERRAGKRVKAGFPRFKKYGRYSSITYPQFGFSVESKVKKRNRIDILRVSKIGTMKMEMHREIAGKMLTLTIKRDGREYYAIVSASTESTRPRIEDTNRVGIDLGLMNRENVMENFAVLSDGKKIGKPNFAAMQEKRIARWQRVVARRQKGSRRREKAREKLHDSWEKVNRQGDDFARKTANDLISSGYTSFAVEGLHIQNMLKNHRLAGAINRAAWNKFIRVLTYKAEDAGMRVDPVEPKDTTRRCSACSAIRDISLGERTYSCMVCGLRIDRDINAARNILHRSTAGHAGIEARGDPASLHPETDAKAGP